MRSEKMSDTENSGSGTGSSSESDTNLGNGGELPPSVLGKPSSKDKKSRYL